MSFSTFSVFSRNSASARPAAGANAVCESVDIISKLHSIVNY
jgi:hypothetical protein